MPPQDNQPDPNTNFNSPQDPNPLNTTPQLTPAGNSIQPVLNPQPNQMHADTTNLPQKTDTMAIVSLILMILGVELVSLILSIISLKRIKRMGEKGRGLALAALVGSIIYGAIQILLLFLAIFAFHTFNKLSNTNLNSTNGDNITNNSQITSPIGSTSCNYSFDVSSQFVENSGTSASDCTFDLDNSAITTQKTEIIAAPQIPNSTTYPNSSVTSSSVQIDGQAVSVINVDSRNNGKPLPNGIPYIVYITIYTFKLNKPIVESGLSQNLLTLEFDRYVSGGKTLSDSQVADFTAQASSIAKTVKIN